MFWSEDATASRYRRGETLTSTRMLPAPDPPLPPGPPLCALLRARGSGPGLCALRLLLDRLGGLSGLCGRFQLSHPLYEARRKSLYYGRLPQEGPSTNVFLLVLVTRVLPPPEASIA
jgi:hypothetical protein